MSPILLLKAAHLLTFVALSFGVIVRDYNRVNFVEIDTFEKFSETFMNLERNTVNQNVMLGVASPECWSKLESPAFRGTQRHSGGGPLVAVSLPSSEFQYPPSLLGEDGLPDACAHVIFYKVGDNIVYPTASTSRLEHRDLNQWLAERMRVNQVITNGFDFDINWFWQEESTDPVFQGENQMQ